MPKNQQRTSIKVTPIVTVVIPTYNHAHFLGSALRSLRAQTFANWEAVVVNNYSQDDTVSVVESFRDPRIRLENFQNGGIIAASRNRGIKLARGRYVAFLDSDDVWYPEKLAHCIVRLEEGYDLVCHGLRWVRENGARDVFYGPAKRASFDSLLYNGNCIATSATMVLRDALKSVAGFSEDSKIVTAEDYHLWMKLARVGARMGFLHEILGEYRFHADNQSGAVLRHMAAVRCVVTSFFDEVPQSSLWGRMRNRRRLGIVYYSAARGLQDNKQFGAAWPWFLRALKCWPFFARTHGALILNVIRRGPHS